MVATGGRLPTHLSVQLLPGPWPPAHHHHHHHCRLSSSSTLATPQVQYGYVNLDYVFRTSSEMSLSSLLGLLVAKIVATGVCVGGGLVGGLFAPSLFLGARVLARVGDSGPSFTLPSNHRPSHTPSPYTSAHAHTRAHTHMHTRTHTVRCCHSTWCCCCSGASLGACRQHMLPSGTGPAQAALLRAGVAAGVCGKWNLKTRVATSATTMGLFEPRCLSVLLSDMCHCALSGHCNAASSSQCAASGVARLTCILVSARVGYNACYRLHATEREWGRNCRGFASGAVCLCHSHSK